MATFPTSVAGDSDLYIAVNNKVTNLSAGISSSDMTIPVASTTGFPSVGYITIDNEIIHYTSVGASQFNADVRGADGTSAVLHLIGVQVNHNVIAAHHNVCKDEIKAIEQYLSDRFGLLSNIVVPDAVLFTAKNINAGASGDGGSIAIFPTTASKGKTLYTTTDNAGNTTTEVITAAQAGARIYTIPDAGASASFVMTESGQTINGNKTLGGTISFSAAALFTPATVANPGITFTGFLSTGIGEASSGSLFFAVPTSKDFNWYINSVQAANLTPTQLAIPDSLVFLSDANTYVSRAGSDNMTVVCGGTTTIDAKTSGVAILGTNTNDSASTGFIGEVVTSNITGNNALPTSNQYGDLGSISLTAGHWMISCNARLQSLNETLITDWAIGMSTTSGNSSTGLVINSNYEIYTVAAGWMRANELITIANFEVKLTSTTTYYLKHYGFYSGGTHYDSGRITAVRIR